MFIARNNCSRAAWLLQVAGVILFTLTVNHAFAQGTLVYSADFESGTPAEFSSGGTSDDQIGAEAINQGLSTYLGKFTLADTTTLTLNGLPAHNFVRLDVDVYFFQTWDGSNATFGDDFFSVSGDISFSETFTNHQGTAESPEQTYPTLADVYLNSDGTAVASFGSSSNTFAYFSLGPTSSGTGFVTPHDAAGFSVTFGGPTSQSDEQWGIDNVRVTVCDTAEECSVAETPPPDFMFIPVPLLENAWLLAVLAALLGLAGLIVLQRNRRV